MNLYKIVDSFRLKALVDAKIYVNQKFKFDLGKVENIVGNGENTGFETIAVSVSK